MAERVLLGNDISAVWNVTNANFGDNVDLYIVDAKGKRKLDVVISSTSKLTFKFTANNQTLGKIRLEIYWITSNTNKRIVANNVLEFVDNPENVTLQSDDVITNITLNTTGIKTAITCS